MGNVYDCLFIDHGVLGHMTDKEIEQIKVRKRCKVFDYAQLSKKLGLINDNLL